MEHGTGFRFFLVLLKCLCDLLSFELNIFQASWAVLLDCWKVLGKRFSFCDRTGLLVAIRVTDDFKRVGELLGIISKYIVMVQRRSEKTLRRISDNIPERIVEKV